MKKSKVNQFLNIMAEDVVIFLCNWIYFRERNTQE